MDWRLLVIRLVVVLNVSLALNYIGWRYIATIYWPNWYIAIPLLVAETYSVIDTCLFSMTMWRARHRQRPPEARSGLTVDVFITCYNEPVELVSQTVRAALKIQYPHRTYVLDDGASDLMRAMAASEGVEYISRADQWSGYSRHAKAGNLNHALMQTEGEFLLILDADQMPRPAILDRTLGYFDDPRMAFVQTPQFFYNVADDDILGAQAPLFYGPLQEGKDGWNAAFFCGSNAVLRREALMQLGITRYVAELERRVPDALATSARVLRRARKELKHLEPNARRSATASLDELEAIVRSAQAGIAGRKSIQAVTWTFQERVRGISTRLVEADLAAMRADLAALAAESGDALDITFEASGLPSDPDVVAALAGRTTSPIIAIEAIRELLLTMDIDRVDEAQALMPMATLSVTEDMATAMRLHASGWKSAFHNELLADGLAPDDLRSTMQQRLRWAQGTLQVFFRENPLGQRGLSLGQRLMYFATMYSYFSGFFVVIYLLAPILFLTLGVKPVTVYSLPFFLRLIPFLVVNQLLFQVAGWSA